VHGAFFTVFFQKSRLPRFLPVFDENKNNLLPEACTMGACVSQHYYGTVYSQYGHELVMLGYLVCEIERSTTNHVSNRYYCRSCKESECLTKILHILERI